MTFWADNPGLSSQEDDLYEGIRHGENNPQERVVYVQVPIPVPVAVPADPYERYYLKPYLLETPQA